MCKVPHIIFLTIFTLLPLAISAQPESGAGEITFLEGTCQVKKSLHGQYQNAVLGQTVYTSERVRTLLESRTEITLTDSSTIFLTEDSEITIDQSVLREDTYTSIGLLFGNIRVFVGRLMAGKEEFAVNTVSVTAGIRGTEFDVAVREDGAVLINVESGEIRTTFDEDQHTIEEGSASTFLITGEREDFERPVDIQKWRGEAIRRIGQNPEAFLLRLLMRERVIIERLREDQERLGGLKDNFEVFRERVADLERQGRYREELEVIQMQIIIVKRVMTYFMRARRNLAVIRSVIVLAARIEQEVDTDVARTSRALRQLRAEFTRITYIIRRITEAERRLRRVLFLLNRKYDELEEKLR
jgi:hypothetical protein